MNPTWRQFLVEQHAIIDDNSVVDFESDDLPVNQSTEDVLCDLSARGLISISGADAVSFMQGQFTTNVPDVTPTDGQLSAWCSPKGRVLTIFTLLAHGEGYLLMMPSDLVSTIVKRLKLYVLRSQVVVEDITQEHLVCIGCQGRQAETMLKQSFAELPCQPYRVNRSNEGVTAIRVPGLFPRYELLGPVDSMMSLWTQLAHHLPARAQAAWSLGDLLAGVPNIRTETTDEYLPQMLNLELIGGVDFNKGCYTGQEIVARTHYLGKVKRRMYLGGVQSNSTPLRGSTLIDGKTNKHLGKIVEAVRKADGGCLALAVVKVDCLDTASSVHLDTLDGPEVQLSTFPYMENPG